MSCLEIISKKYQTRKGPPYHAKDCKGKLRKGNDGRFYISLADKNGVYKWVPRTSKSRNPIHRSNKPMIRRAKSYTIIDNGGRPFVVDVYPSHVEIYLQKYQDDLEKWIKIRDKKVLETQYKKIFIGDNDLRLSDGTAPKGMFPGNSVLIKTGNGKYIYVGDGIYSFDTRNKEEILKYYSPVGNSAVPYPYAIGKDYTYFLLDKETLPNELLNLKEDAYPQFYGHTIKDKDFFKEIEGSKRKFRTKRIHKRGI